MIQIHHTPYFTPGHCGTVHRAALGSGLHERQVFEVLPVFGRLHYRKSPCSHSSQALIKPFDMKRVFSTFAEVWVPKVLRYRSDSVTLLHLLCFSRVSQHKTWDSLVCQLERAETQKLLGCAVCTHTLSCRVVAMLQVDTAHKHSPPSLLRSGAARPPVFVAFYTCDKTLFGDVFEGTWSCRAHTLHSSTVIRLVFTDVQRSRWKESRWIVRCVGKRVFVR